MFRRMIIAALILIIGMIVAPHSNPSIAQDRMQRPRIDPSTTDQLTPLAWLGTGPVFNVQWSPYNNLFAVANGAGVWLYDSISLQPHGRLGTEADMSAWSPYGSRLATTHDNVIRIWDPFTGELRAVLEGHPNWINSIAWSPDGTKLASANGSFALLDGELGSVRIWDVETHELVLLIGGDSASPDFEAHSVVWSPDSRFVAAITQGGTVTAWDAQSGETALIFDLDTDYRLILAWSPDGKYFAVGGGDGEIRIYDGYTGEEVAVLPAQDEPTWELAFSADGTTLASGHREGVVIFWDVPTWTLIRRVRHNQDDILTMSFSGDGSQLAAAGSDDLVRILDVQSGEQVGILQAHTGAAWDGVFSSDGQTIFTTGLNHRLDAWDTGTWRSETFINRAEFISQIIPSPDGEWVAIVGSGLFVDGRLIEAGLLLISTDGHTTRLIHEVDSSLTIGQTVIFSPNGQHLAAVVDDEVWVWSIDDGQVVITFPTSDPLIENGLKWSPDGTQLALTSRSFNGSAATLWVWDIETGEEIVKLVHDHSISAISWSDSGIQLATVYVSGDGFAQTDVAVESIQLWDVANAAQGPLLLGHSDEVRLLLWSPDGSRLASGSYDGTVRVWDKAGGDPLFRLTVSGRVRDVQWSPDGNIILVQSDDFSLRFYDGSTGAFLYLILFDESGEFSWSPDGRLIVENIGGTVRLWGIPSQQDCVISTQRSVNRRWWADVGTVSMGTISNSERWVATGQGVDFQGIRWWQLADHTWVRSDVVDATGECETLSLVVED